MFPQGILSDDVVVDPAGNVQYALVFIKSGLTGPFEVPKQPVIMEQKGCRFEPHVFGIMAGQELLIKNGDQVLHIIHVVPKNNKEWGFSQAKVGDERVKIFDKPEFPIRVFCDVHQWMYAWAGVLEHPFHSTTNLKGAFEIKGVPPGKYVVEVWHEKYKSVEQEVEVKAKETKTVAFTLTEAKPQ
jgi:hypothetical protein